MIDQSNLNSNAKHSSKNSAASLNWTANNMSDLLIKYKPSRHFVADMQNPRIKKTVEDTGRALKISKFLDGRKISLSHSNVENIHPTNKSILESSSNLKSLKNISNVISEPE